MTAMSADDAEVAGFRARLAEQRWDDHRFYHHSLVNQSLHFVSACTAIARSVSRISVPSVISSSSREGARPVRASSADTSATTFPCCT